MVPGAPITSRRRSIILTEQEIDARNARRAEQEYERKMAVERQQCGEIEEVWDRIPPATRSIFEYIEREIPRREDSKDVQFLRETRAIHFAPYRRFLKEVSA